MQRLSRETNKQTKQKQNVRTHTHTHTHSKQNTCVCAHAHTRAYTHTQTKQKATDSLKDAHCITQLIIMILPNTECCRLSQYITDPFNYGNCCSNRYD